MDDLALLFHLFVYKTANEEYSCVALEKSFFLHFRSSLGSIEVRFFACVFIDIRFVNLVIVDVEFLFKISTTHVYINIGKAIEKKKKKTR